MLAQSEIQGILMKHRISIISQENTWTPTLTNSYSVNNSRPSTASDLVFIDQGGIPLEVILEFDQTDSIENGCNVNNTTSDVIKRAMEMTEN